MLENEAEIIEKAKRNSRHFGKIFDAYYDTIFNYVLRRVSNPHQSRDIVSEVFYKALAKLHSFKWMQISILNWLYRIASNEISLYFRKPDHSFSSIEFLEQLNVQFRSNSNLEEELQQAHRKLQENDEFLRIQKEMQLLPISDQEVLALRFFEDKKIVEIAEILELREDVAKARLYRAIKKLQKRVTK